MKTLQRNLLILLVLLCGGRAIGCDVTAGPGAVVRYSEGKSGGTATVGCVFGKDSENPWELRAWWVGEQRIYGGQVAIEAFPALSASRLWIFRRGTRFQPILGMGLMVKESHRCRYKDQVDCNRQVPLSFCFLPTAGFRLGDVLVTAFHCSNASLDWGPEKKNLGLDGLRAEVWF